VMPLEYGAIAIAGIIVSLRGWIRPTAPDLQLGDASRSLESAE
jgi:hypothetical protein